MGDQTTVAYLEGLAETLATLAERAAEAQSYTAAVQARREERLVRARLDEIREYGRQLEDLPDTVEEHRREVRLVVRQMRLAAQSAGSHVAAARLLQLEDQILSRHQAELEAGEAEEIARRRLEEIEAEIDRLRAQRAD